MPSKEWDMADLGVEWRRNASWFKVRCRRIALAGTVFYHKWVGMEKKGERGVCRRHSSFVAMRIGRKANAQAGARVLQSCNSGAPKMPGICGFMCG